MSVLSVHAQQTANVCRDADVELAVDDELLNLRCDVVLLLLVLLTMVMSMSMSMGISMSMREE
jgi:hypothetical protein